MVGYDNSNYLLSNLMSNGEIKRGARSFNGTRIDDSFNININIKWMLQIIGGCVALVYTYVQVINRLETLESGVEDADQRISELIEKHVIKESEERKAMEERISFFEKELNLNPFSWKKKRKK